MLIYVQPIDMMSYNQHLINSNLDKGNNYYKGTQVREITKLCSIILFISVIILGCSPTPSNSQVSPDVPITPPEPQSTPTIQPNCGVISGYVSYFDDMPASGVSVALFEEGSTTSDYIIYTDINGKYTWSNIPTGNYEIFTGLYRLDSPISFVAGISTEQELLPPDAIITVNDQQTTDVQTIIIPREITYIYAEDFSPPVDITLPSQDVIITPPSTFSWEAVPLATSYSVLFRPLNYEAANYADSITVTTPNITSPTVLPPYGYYLIIRAFDEQRRLVGVGIGFFTIK
jgi:hypothetical protein